MNIKAKIFRIILFGLALAGGGYFIWAQLAHNQATQQAQANAARQAPLTRVATAPVQAQTTHQQLRAVGVFRPFEVLELLAETDGKVQQVHFDVHSGVRPGQVLATLEATGKLANLRLAELNHQKALRDLARYEALFKHNNLAEIELENARHQAQSAEQNLRLAQQAVDFTILKSPIAGTVSQKLAGVGRVLQPGSPVAVITNIARLRLVVNVAAQDLALVRVGAQVPVLVPAWGNGSLTGTIKAVAVQGTEAGTFPVELWVANPPGQPLRAGMSAEVAFPAAGRSSLLIPRLALVNDQVFVVQNGQALAKKITPGQEFGENLEVLAGLIPGEQVVVKGQANLTNGQKIQTQ
jgi:membrane fusion protein, multidrug efflux system